MMTFRHSIFWVALVSCVFPSIGKAAIVTYTDPAAYLAQLASLSLTETGFTNFDSMSTGTMGTSFTAGGIGFTSSVSMGIHNGTTSSPSQFLGINNMAFPDFETGQQVTLTLPANSRAVSLRIITETPPDALAFASLTVNGSGAISTSGGAMLDGNFRSYFLGVIDNSSQFGSAVVDFGGTGLGFYRIDDVGVAALASVPEPNSLILLVAGMGLFFRRK
jgi:PEP-CTERM motif